MNRRRFVTASAALPFAVRALMLDGPAARAERPTAVGATGKPNLDRYQLTRDRVLAGSRPAYTQEFLLEDLHGLPGRRFTNFSGDLSGRWIGALSACSASFGENFPALDEFVNKALPLQHAEVREVQDESVAAYRRLLTEAPPELRGTFESALQSAQLHRSLIEQFGRFPHRNRALGRSATPDEETWLREHPESLGQ